MFGNAVVHGYVPKADVAADKMVTDLEVSHVAKSGRVGGNVQASHRVSVHSVWLGARVPEETHHVFSMN